MKGRKPLSVGAKQNKEEFEEQLKGYSTKALKNIIALAENSFDTSTRLKANQYLIDKCYGRDYKAIVPEKTKQDTETHITLTVVKPTYNLDIEQINKEIEQMENTSESLDDDVWSDVNRL